MSQDRFWAETRPIDHDSEVDDGIRDCLSLGSGESFITYAGAGSGKTYSLKEVLDFLKSQHSKNFSRQGKQIAVVTFTNNAADEIKDRIEQNPIFAVSTIHSFCWSAISGFNDDIREWYLEKTPVDLAEVEELERRGRSGTKASDARRRTITRLREKLEWLAEPRTFIYDPNGVNSSQNSLSHADVLKIFSNFLIAKPMMAEVIVSKFPFIFIDESQDTNKDVVNAFFELQENKSEHVVIGLFGDAMQRIFGGGEPELGKSKPSGWTAFDKEMNHRSARRIVGLGNQIRSEDDGRMQFARDGAKEGIVRFFLLPHGIENKEETEANIRKEMAKLSGDAAWTDTENEQTVTLLLEHKMAGRRLGFSALWDCLSKSDRIRDRISEGENTELNFFSNIVFPLVDASVGDRHAQLMSILRERNSPLLEESVLAANQDDPLAMAREAVRVLNKTVSDSKISFRAVLEVIAEHNLLQIPSKLMSFVPREDEGGTVLEEDSGVDEGSSEAGEDSEISAWSEALETEFFQIRHYQSYIDEQSAFRTHQGVKGNEFERVMVVMDDDEAGGFMFSYEQYFGAKKPSERTIQNISAGKETGLDRTRRLFYVTSTRAKSSLAHVIYTSEIASVKVNLLERKFAREDEIVCR